MTQAVLSLNADARTTSPARNSSIFVMSDGALVAIWVEGKNGPGTDRVIRRYRSADGITWTRMSDLTLGSLLGTTDPVDGSKQIYPLFSQSVTGNDTIAGFSIAVPASSSFMFTMSYSAIQKDFTADTLVGSYAPTNAWDGLGQGTGTVRSGYTDYGKMLYDTTHSDHIVVFDALVAGQEYIYLIAWDTAAGKITELRFTNAANQSCRFPDFVVQPGVPTVIALVYQRLNYGFRTYTYDGATFTAGAADEVIPGGPTISSGGPRIFVNNAGTYQIFYENFTTNAALITRARTGVATYSAAVEIATDLPYGAYLSTVGPEDQFALKKVGADDLYVFYKKTTNNFRGELYYVRRNFGVWGAQTPWKTGANNGFNHPSTGPFLVGADHKLHMLYSRGADVYPGSWTLFYDFLYDGTPSAPTNITPSTRGETSPTPIIFAKYVQNRAGDNLGFYRVRVLRSSDSSVFWDTGGSGTPYAGTLAPGGIFGVVYAGTPLVEGTDYYIEVYFWDIQESYFGPIGTTVATPFAWNDPPSKIAVALTSDPTNGKQRTALYPLAPASATTEKAPATAELFRKLTSDVLFASLKTGLTFTAPATQTGFTAYRQLPEKIGRNLVINGGFAHGPHGWGGPGEVVADALSPTGFAIRNVAAGAGGNNKTQIVPVEAGKAYSLAVQMRTDGVADFYTYFLFRDAAGNVLAETDLGNVHPGVYTEYSAANVIAPGNARDVLIGAATKSAAGAGIGFVTAIRVMQQAGAPAAWTSAHQQYLSRGLAIYEAGTNLLADGDMEAVGVASWTANAATLTKDAVTFFAGAKALKVVTTAIGGGATQTGALAAGQAITASTRVKGGDANTRLELYTTPSNALIGAAQFNPNTTDWNTLRVSGVIAGGDTGWKIALIGGGNAVTSYWDNAAIENKAYDTMNADPTGQAFALAGRTVSDVRAPLLSSLTVSDFAIVATLRLDHAYNAIATSRVMWAIYNATDYAFVRINGGTGRIDLAKSTASVETTANDAIAAAPAAGDTLSIGAIIAPGGLTLIVYKNGALVGTYTNTSDSAKLPFAPGAAVLSIGHLVGGNDIDGTLGALRIMRGGLSAAMVQAVVADPYQPPSSNDLAVWQFEGFTSQVPSFDDRLVKLGTSYDYRVVGTAAAATPTQSTGEQISGSVASSAVDAWWIRDATDSTKDLQLYVRHDSGYEFERGRPMSIATPLQGGPRSVIYGATPFGDEGHLALIYPTAALRDATEAALKALQATNNATWLQDPFGGLRKIRISAPITYRPQLTPADLESDLSFIEVP